MLGYKVCVCWSVFTGQTVEHIVFKVIVFCLHFGCMIPLSATVSSDETSHAMRPCSEATNAL